MLRIGTNLSWLLRPSDPEMAVPSAAQMIEIHRIRNLASIAEKRGLDHSGAAQDAISAVRAVILAEIAWESIMRDATVTDDDIARYGAAHPGIFDQYAIRHIFVASGQIDAETKRSESDASRRAMEIKRKIDSGADFSALAKTHSDDAATASEGGLLSPVLGSNIADTFFPLLAQLPEGGTAGPVQGQSGYHVLRLDRRITPDKDVYRRQARDAIIVERRDMLIQQALK
ncbi:peptidylprolyl isomerase [Xanthomonas theicola]